MQMLDALLMMYVDIPEKMNAGVSDECTVMVLVPLEVKRPGMLTLCKLCINTFVTQGNHPFIGALTVEVACL